DQECGSSEPLRNGRTLLQSASVPTKASLEDQMQTNAFDALYIPANDTPWFPYGPAGCEVRLIKADPTTGQWIVKLRGHRGDSGGIHRHYGAVIGFTLRGAWRYLEHEWISRTGDLVQETPGSVHTLVLQEDSEILFIVDGALEYLDPEGRTLAHEDWKSVIDKYREFCAARGQRPIDITRPRAIARDRVVAV